MEILLQFDTIMRPLQGGWILSTLFVLYMFDMFLLVWEGVKMECRTCASGTKNVILSYNVF